jgi:hypothetical protein
MKRGAHSTSQSTLPSRVAQPLPARSVERGGLNRKEVRLDKMKVPRFELLARMGEGFEAWKELVCSARRRCW